MKKKDLNFAAEQKLPLDMATETFGFLGKKGKGKTYGAQRLFELLHAAGVQCVALDPVGNWWSLRVGKDGKSPGLPVYVFGGPRGDVPILPDAGAFVARVIVEKRISVILDVSRFRKAERKRFMTAFAEEFFHLKKDAVSPVHLFVEEAHKFVPQMVRDGEEQMLGAMEDIVRIGRNYGIGASLISQRSASVNKDVLSQVECLVAYQTSGRQDKKAIVDWVEENDEEGVGLLSELKSLQRGEALFWSPSALRVFRKIHVTEKETLDASSTPKVGSRTRKPVRLASVDLKGIEAAMQEVVAQAEANDVGALKRRVKQLEAELAKRQPVERIKVKEVKTRECVPIVPHKLLAHLDRVIDKMLASQDRLNQTAQVVASEAGNLRSTIQDTLKKVEATYVRNATPTTAAVGAQKHPHPSKLLTPRPAEPKARYATASPPADGEWSPPQGARMIMAVLERAGAGGLPRKDAAIKSLMTPTSGTFTTYVSKLKSGGYVGEADGNLVLIKKLSQLPTPTEPGQPLVEEWAKEFDGKARDILRFVAKAYPSECDRPMVAEGVGMPPDSGTFTTYMSRISGKGLFEKVGRRVKASTAMMET